MTRRLVKRDKERIAFWTAQIVGLTVTVASIWFASRIGYQQAVRFSHWKELRTHRNVLRAAKHELALNERALRDSLRDLTDDDFRNLHVVTRAYERMRDGEDLLSLDREAVSALTKAYSPDLQESIDQIHQGHSGAILVNHAVTLTRHLEHMQDSIPLLESKVEGLNARLAGYGVQDPPVPTSWPPEQAPSEVRDVERETLELPSTAGWSRADSPPPYTGPIPEKIYWDSTLVPPLNRGPLLLTFNGRNLPKGSKVKRAHLVLTQRSPLPLRQELDEAGQRAALAGNPSVESFVLSVDLPQGDRMQSWHAVDINLELGWRWVYVVMEDEQGTRYPARLGIWQIGAKNDGWNLRLKPDSERMLVLPRGYRP